MIGDDPLRGIRRSIKRAQKKLAELKKRFEAQKAATQQPVKKKSGQK